MLRKRPKHGYERFTFLLVCNCNTVVFFILFLDEVGIVVCLLDNYMALNSLCFRFVLFSIHLGTAMLSLGLDLS